MGSRELPCAVAPKLSPAESKCTLKSFRCALLCGADIRLDQKLICRVRAAAAAALSRLRWSTFGLLACARCAFLSRMVLPPQRGAHFAYLRDHEHHLGLAKWSSRLRAVRIFMLSYEKQMFLVRRPSPACLLRTCHRALACAACSFLNKTALSPRCRAHFAFKLFLEQ